MTSHDAGTGPWRKQEASARLTSLFFEGLSASQISDILTEELDVTISRNAVIGKVHRLQLTRVKKVNAPRKPRAKSEKKKVVLDPVARAAKEPPLPVAITRDNLILIELRANHCRFPLGETRPFRFCCRPRLEGSPYCARHNLIVHYQPRF